MTSKIMFVSVRCPSLETGRNSVNPCTPPRTSDSSHSIGLLVVSCEGSCAGCRSVRRDPAAEPGDRHEDVPDPAVDRQADGQPGQGVAGDEPSGGGTHGEA